jgi:hypothetical protein
LVKVIYKNCRKPNKYVFRYLFLVVATLGPTLFYCGRIKPLGGISGRAPRLICEMVDLVHPSIPSDETIKVLPRAFFFEKRGDGAGDAESGLLSLLAICHLPLCPSIIRTLIFGCAGRTLRSGMWDSRMRSWMTNCCPPNQRDTPIHQHRHAPLERFEEMVDLIGRYNASHTLNCTSFAMEMEGYIFF